MDCQGAPGNGGWTIGADGVDVNLGGNTFRGFSPIGTGIANPGHDNVTIRNGTISGWATTISLTDASGNSIRDLDGFRVSISGGEDNEFRRISARLSASGSSGLTVADSQLQAGFGSQSAPALTFTGDGARILRNLITGSVLEPGSSSRVGQPRRGQRGEPGESRRDRHRGGRRQPRPRQPRARQPERELRGRGGR